jgi:pimeloyl-ACP methyl ester carboxylesterase
MIAAHDSRQVWPVALRGRSRAARFGCGAYIDRRADGAAVGGPDGPEPLRVRWSLQLGKVGGLFGEHLLYPAGHDYPEDAHAAVGGIGEGVRDLPGQPGETARAQVVPLLAQLDQQVAVDHVQTLVFAVVDVQRRPRRPGPDYSLDEGEQAAGVCRSGLGRRESARVAAEWYEVDVRSVLPAITVPTLVSARSDQAIFSAHHSRYLAEHIAGATYIEFPGTDLFYYTGNADEC